MGNQPSRDDLSLNEDQKNPKNTTSTKNNFSNQKYKNRNKVVILTSEKKESSDSGFLKDNSSYNGVKSLTDYSSRSASQGEIFEKETDEVTNDVTEVSNKELCREQEVRDLKVMINFVWKEGGREVYLTGSFCNWKQTFLMNCLNNRFECNLVINLNLLNFIKICEIFLKIFDFFKNFSNFLFIGTA